MTRYAKGSPCIVCEIRPLRYVTTGECPNCYNRRHYANNAERRKAWLKQWAADRYASYGDSSSEIPEDLDRTSPIAYSTAHARVTRWRGRAARYTCVCGRPAREWAYRGESEYEQRGTVPTFSGVSEREVGWSPDPMDYEPLCRSCHVTKDKAHAAGR